MERSDSTKPFQVAQPSDRLVYLVTTDSNFATQISQQIIHFGYFVQHVRDIESLVNFRADQNAIAVIFDIQLEKDQAEEHDDFQKINDLQLSFHNFIFTSIQDNQSIRMKSIQAGGVAFFVRPVNIVGLIDKLDSLNKSNEGQYPGKVLIVEDQQSVASYYQMVLKMAGFDAQITINPNNVLQEMHEFHPDLILMNTFLSEINPADLARVIRQIDNFVSIPIIFLSNDADFGKRIESLDLGGDDFLIKPIKASHLVAIVRSRLERSKKLRSYMVRDSLTNLLNHTAFTNVLSQELNRCKRQNTSIALAMLDIDHFKTVNDTYGHSTGDNALKSLSRLLHQRLRRSDIAGRYGGDEFVALMLDCEAEQALRIMNEIRSHFSEIEFSTNKAKPLSLTFSCGIATFPQFQSVESLSDSADRALYQAKEGQRNRIIIANH